MTDDRAAMRWMLPLVSMLAACGASDRSNLDSSRGESNGSEATDAEAWFEVGWGVDRFNHIESDLPVVLGPQGAWMFSLPLRGGGFDVPQPPRYDDPRTPRLDLAVVVEGWPSPLTAVEDLPVAFVPIAEPGTYEYRSAWLVIPDDVAPEDLAGRSATIEATLRVAGDEPLQRTYTATVDH